jgi:hypothetical protein
MAIVSTDIKYRLSGGAANSDAALSLGGVISSVDAPSNLFPNVSSSNAAAGITEYRCVYVLNNHGSLTLENAKVWIQTNTPSATTAVSIALAGEGLNGTAETVAAGGLVAPVGETFTAPSSEGTGLSLGNIPAGQKYAVWIKRVVDASSPAYSNDGFTLRVKGDTAA